MHRLIPILLLAAPIMASAQPPAPFTIEETGQTFRRLGDAVAAAGDGDATIRIAAGVHRDCAVQTAGRIAYRAAQAGVVTFDGVACEGKAALVLRGRAAAVDGITFRNLRVPDGNGAGIRLERGSLQVTNSRFEDSEEGILTADDPAATISVDRSTFTGLGRCDRGLSCAHSIYVGDYGALEITRSRFERGTGGHYVKSRARRIIVSDSSFDDTRGRTTNYMIDLSAGARGEIARNIFVQGADKENYSSFITIAPEGRANPSTGLVIADNQASIAPGIDRRTIFVADWSGDALALGANRLGPGIAPFETRR